MSGPGRVRIAFGCAAIVEATTYLVLLAAVVSSRVLDGADLVRPIGWIHGVAFLLYAALAIRLGRLEGWSVRRTTEILVAAVIPLGGYVVAHRLTLRDP